MRIAPCACVLTVHDPALPAPPDAADVTPDPAPSSPEELLRLRLAVEASGEVIFMTNARGTITYVNPEFVRLYGYRPSEVVGRCTPRILKSGVTSDADYASFWQHLRNNQVVRREFVNRTKSGVLVEVESSANPIVADGDRIGFLAVQRDISARKATEAALRQSEMRYRTLAEAAHDSIFIVDRDGCIEYANGVSTDRFGVRSDEAIGKRLHDVFPRKTADEMWRQLSIVFANGERQRIEQRFETASGDIWFDTWLVPMSPNAEAPDAVMGIARDITDQKHLERQFIQAQKMEAVGRLAGGIAHDFNNLLTAILGYGELLMDHVREMPGLATDVDEILKAGDRARRLTRQLLAFSRKEVLTPCELDLNEIVGDLQKMLRRLIGEDVCVEVELGEDLHRVTADPGQIEQVVINLAVNARDAMPQGGLLRIATANVMMDDPCAGRSDATRRRPCVALSVQDNGCGMPAEILAHAFEPFFTTKAAGKGTGLGLATVYGIVKQSHGHITIDSSPGSGTTVTAIFPAVVGLAQASEPSLEDDRTVGGTETILLVEDDPGVRNLMQRTLETRGYTVLSTLSTDEALSIAQSHGTPIDLLVSDVIMPGLSGPDLAQRIVSLRPAITVLYVSGFTANFALNSGTTSMRSAFLAKPFTAQALARKVRACLDTVS